MVIWCTLLVMMDCGFGPKGPLCTAETAVKGKILNQTDKKYLVDFSEYAKQQGYHGLSKPVIVHDDKCVKE